MKQDAVMQSGDKIKYKYVFVCGLARSGTSLVGRNIARLDNCTGFKNTGAGSDEGQFLQDVYPIAAACGSARPGWVRPACAWDRDLTLADTTNFLNLLNRSPFNCLSPISGGKTRGEVYEVRLLLN